MAIHGEQGWMLEQLPVPSVELPGGGLPVEPKPSNFAPQKAAATH
jgi:hypothetical protein